MLAAAGLPFPGEQPCSGNVAISGCGCSQEMRRQQGRGFFEFDGIFSYFVARNAQAGWSCSKGFIETFDPGKRCLNLGLS